MPITEADNPLSHEDWSRLQRRLVWVYSGPVAPGNRNMVRPFDDNGAWLVHRGSARIETDAGSLTAGPGQWLLPAPRRLTRQIFEPGSEILSIRFRLSWPGGTPLYREGLPITFAAARFPLLKRGAMALNDVIPRPAAGTHTPLRSQQLSLADFVEIEARFADFLIAWCQTMSALNIRPSRLTRSDPRVRSAIALLNNLPRGEKLSHLSIAKHVGITAGQLDRLFIRETGQTVRQFHEGKRLAEANHLLASSTRQVKQIAFDLGFSRVSHFSAWFKKHAKVSARQFRTSASHIIE